MKTALAVLVGILLVFLIFYVNLLAGNPVGKLVDGGLAALNTTKMEDRVSQTPMNNTDRFQVIHGYQDFIRNSMNVNPVNCYWKDIADDSCGDDVPVFAMECTVEAKNISSIVSMYKIELDVCERWSPTQQ